MTQTSIIVPVSFMKFSMWVLSCHPLIQSTSILHHKSNHISEAQRNKCIQTGAGDREDTTFLNGTGCEIHTKTTIPIVFSILI